MDILHSATTSSAVAGHKFSSPIKGGEAKPQECGSHSVVDQSCVHVNHTIVEFPSISQDHGQEISS